MAITVPFNNYAKVTTIGTDGKTITYTDKTADGIAKISTNSLVMFHVSKHKDSADMNLLGKFILAKVLSDDGNSLTLDTAVTKVFEPIKLNKYDCQIISVAQFNNLTIDYNYNATTAWNDNKKIGGICAIACRGLLNLEGGYINVEGKGGGSAYGREGLAVIGNAQDCDKLPLGQGHGSIFLIANKMVTNVSSRLGATYDGSNFGGNGAPSNSGGGIGGGYAGTADVQENQCKGGSGAGVSGAIGAFGCNGAYGGYGCNAANKKSATYDVGKQGAHIFSIINKLNLFNLANWSTGGSAGYEVRKGISGGAGYGAGGSGWSAGYAGAGGYNGGGGGDTYNYPGSAGGSSGWAFIYCNNIENKDDTGVVII